jgi:hypothetical protein
MSIWIDLLFMHGHFATPRHLADLLAPAAAQKTPPADGPDGSADNEREIETQPERQPEIEDAVQTWPLDDVLCDPAPYVRSFPVVHHPFRSVGQLP